MSVEVVIAGLAVGVLIGLTGIGGGSIITPALVFIFRIHPLYAVGTDLSLGALTKIAGAMTHVRLGNVHAATTRLLLSGSIPGALVGLLLLKFLPTYTTLPYDSFIEPSLGVVLLLVSTGLFFPSIWSRVRRWKLVSQGTRFLWVVRLAAFFVGVAVSITSVGSGSLLVPLLLAAFPFPLSQIVGIDVIHGAVLTSFAASGHLLAMESLNYHLLLNLLIGSVPGVIVGSKLSTSIPRRVVEIAVASMLVISGVKLL